jgi:hypothetical protein
VTRTIQLRLRIAATVAMIALSLLISERSHAETGFTYSLVKDFPITATPTEGRLCSYSYNDLGQIAYVTLDADSGVSLYFWDGKTSQLVYNSQAPTSPGDAPFIFCSPVRGGVGLNNDGLISTYGYATDSRSGQIGEGFLFFRVGQRLISTQFPSNAGAIYETRGLLNNAGQVAWRSANRSFAGTVGVNGVTNDGFSNPYPSTITPGGPIVNDKGIVAQVAEQPDTSGNDLLLLLLDDTLHLTAGVDFNKTSVWFPPQWSTPGLNSAGFASLATTGPSPSFPKRQFRVILMNPDLKTFNVLADETNTTPSATALPGISLNNKNQVFFGIHDNSAGVDSLWLTTSSQSPPLPVWSEVNPLTVGGTTITNAFVGSDAEGPQFAINSSSDMAFTIISDRIRLLIAHPDPGWAPGNPVLPVGPPLPGGGWQFFVNCYQYGMPTTHKNPTWCEPGEPGVYIDPPLATGYVYSIDPGAPKFASVYIPAPLPGGQKAFTVQYNGVSAELTAGMIFSFTDQFPAGVDSFKITGINVSEQLDPTNAGAFVAGLTFLTIDNPSASFTMVPLVDGAAPTITPTISGVQGANDWYVSDVSVSFSILDPSSLVTSSSGCAMTTITADTAGTQLTCTANGIGGPWSDTVILKRDTLPPQIAIVVPVNGASYAAGSIVNANYTCKDLLSGVASCFSSIAPGSPVDTGTPGTKQLMVTATDSAGNKAVSSVSYTVTASAKDATPPSIIPTVSGTLGDNGWYRSNVTVNWLVTDTDSAITSTSGCGAGSVTNDTSGKSFTCTATSSGGTSNQSITIKKDDDAPLAAIVLPFDGMVLNRNERIPAVYLCVDIRSGVAQCDGSARNGSLIDASSAGTKVFSLNAKDKAGNIRTVTVHYKVR